MAALATIRHRANEVNRPGQLDLGLSEIDAPSGVKDGISKASEILIRISVVRPLLVIFDMLGMLCNDTRRYLCWQDVNRKVLPEARDLKLIRDVVILGEPSE